VQSRVAMDAMVASLVENSSAEVAPVAPPAAILPRYVGATFAGSTGAGMEGLRVDTVGGEVFTGGRLSRWVSLEGLFAYHFSTAPSPGPAVGAATWAENRYEWQTLGLRLWIHLVHARAVDFSLGAMAAAGLLVDHVKNGFINSSRPAFAGTTHGFELDGGLAVALEVRPTRWLGVRVGVDTGIASVGVLALTGWLGPVVRF